MNGLLIKDCKLAGDTPCSVYCADGKVVRISEDDQPILEATEVIEANGGSLFPGLVDSHCHPFEYGWLKRSVDLRGTTNVTGMRLRLSAGIQRAKPGEWVTGMGWDQEAFPGGRMPVRNDIDDISLYNPVALMRICGHVALLNGRALDELGFASKQGEEFERDLAGNLTGVVKETALGAVLERIPRTKERAAADLQSVEAEAARLGLTTLHCIISSEGFREELGALESLQMAGSLSLRYRLYIPPEALEFVREEKLSEKLAGPKVKINGVKIYTDGSLGARTAALRHPYSDDQANSGILRYKDAELSELVERVDSQGLQAVVHAIGDRAVEQAVEAVARVAGTKNPRRHRIEHASLLPRDLRSKMSKHDIRAAVQPMFVTSDTWALDRLGEERIRDLYPFRSMLEDGIIVSGGSDSPVESMSPVLGMWAAMTRGGSTPEETLGLEEALSLYTSNAASNGFDDEGPLLVEGSPANLTLLDSDTVGMHPALFRKVGVLATIVDGSVVHSYGSG